MELKKTDIVVQSNELILYPFNKNLTLNEERFIKYLIALTYKIDFINNKEWYKSKKQIGAYNYKHEILIISADEFCTLYSTTHDSFYKLAKRLAVSFLAEQGKKSKLHLIEDNKNEILHIFYWLDYISYENGFLEARLSYEIIKHILNLNGDFTRYEIDKIIYFKTAYSFRLYSIFRQYIQHDKKYIERDFEWEEIRNIIGAGVEYVPSYSIFGNFKNSVLIPSINEINEKTDVNISFKEIKEIKNIKKIKFTIKLSSETKSNSKENINNEEKSITKNVPRETLEISYPNIERIGNIECAEISTNLGIAKNILETSLDNIDKDRVLNVYKHICILRKEGKSINPSGLFLKILKENWKIESAEKLEELKKYDSKIKEAEKCYKTTNCWGARHNFYDYKKEDTCACYWCPAFKKLREG